MPEFIERLKGARVSLNVFDSARDSILQNLTKENLAYIHTQHPELARLLETDAASDILQDLQQHAKNNDKYQLDVHESSEREQFSDMTRAITQFIAAAGDPVKQKQAADQIARVLNDTLSIIAQMPNAEQPDSDSDKDSVQTTQLHVPSESADRESVDSTAGSDSVLRMVERDLRKSSIEDPTLKRYVFGQAVLSDAEAAINDLMRSRLPSQSQRDPDPVLHSVISDLRDDRVNDPHLDRYVSAQAPTAGKAQDAAGLQRHQLQEAARPPAIPTSAPHSPVTRMAPRVADRWPETADKTAQIPKPDSPSPSRRG